MPRILNGGALPTDERLRTAFDARAVTTGRLGNPAFNFGLTVAELGVPAPRRATSRMSTTTHAR